jgi:hypothetical protein
MVLFFFQRWLKKTLLQLQQLQKMVLLLQPKMADNVLLQLIKKLLLLSKMASKGAITAVEERLCCYQRGLAMALLSSKNSAAPFKDGAVAAARDGWQYCCCSY